MENYKELEEEIKKAWKDDYFISLGIYQHLVECKQKFEAVKNHAINSLPKDKLQLELDKELADLKILLDIYVKESMINERLKKFQEKINKNIIKNTK